MRLSRVRPSALKVQEFESANTMKTEHLVPKIDLYVLIVVSASLVSRETPKSVHHFNQTTSREETTWM